MRTARSSSRPGGVSTRHPLNQAPPPGAGTPRAGTPRAGTPRAGTPLGAGTPWKQAPLPLWTEFLTHACENITLPQTSFAGGKNHAKCSFYLHKEIRRSALYLIDSHNTVPM